MKYFALVTRGSSPGSGIAGERKKKTSSSCFLVVSLFGHVTETFTTQFKNTFKTIFCYDDV